MPQWKLLSLYATLSLILPSSLAAHGQSNTVEISSPDRRIILHFAVKPDKDLTSGDGQLVYSIDFRGKQMFEDSALGLELANQSSLGSKVHFTGSTPGSGVDQYKLLAGKTSEVRDAYNDLTVDVAEGAASGREFSIQARVYNDAVAFRYHVPEQASH
jgi:alpha-glucosidase